ncbi:MAG: NAD(P)-dependent oxidoreductase [Granulosicoccus sp.]
MIGIIGCGAMGGAMTQRLQEQGNGVVCYDESPEALATIAGYGAEITYNLAELASRCTTIILSLPNAAIISAVMNELGGLLKSGSVILDTSTSEPDTTRQLAAEATRAGYAYVDGPVSGGPAGARNGTMTMVLGGSAQDIEHLQPLLSLLTAKTVHIGPSGSGHAAKIANNLLCAANLALLSEMAHLASAQGIALEKLLDGVNAGSGRSGVSEVNFPKWIINEQYNSGFTMGLMRKDVGLAVALAERSGLDLPATRAIAAIWEASRESLADKDDFNEIYRFAGTV